MCNPNAPIYTNSPIQVKLWGCIVIISPFIPSISYFYTYPLFFNSTLNGNIINSVYNSVYSQTAINPYQTFTYNALSKQYLYSGILWQLNIPIVVYDQYNEFYLNMMVRDIKVNVVTGNLLSSNIDVGIEINIPNIYALYPCINGNNTPQIAPIPNATSIGALNTYIFILKTKVYSKIFSSIYKKSKSCCKRCSI